MRKNPWGLEHLTQPDPELPSAYEQIRSGKLDPLPDDELVFKKAKFSWVGGAMDGVFGHLSSGTEPKKRIFGVVSAVQKLERDAQNKFLQELYELASQESFLSIVDFVVEELEKDSKLENGARLAAIGRYFATRFGRREAVKFGLALIGVFGSREDVEILKTLGKNDEFTLYAAVAIARVSEHPEQALWEMAKNVQGWGRVQIVRRLKDTQNEEMQAWMLRDGFRNDVMNEYLACICARTGHLHEALTQKFVDQPLLDGAADIIQALTEGGPAEGIDDYERAAEVCESYLNLVWARPTNGLNHLMTVLRLRSFLASPSDWTKRLTTGWTESRREQMKTICESIISRETWRPMVDAALASADEQAFFEGDQVAQALGIDTWEAHYKRVKESLISSSSWFRLMQQTDDTRIDEVLGFAESVLPLERIETGPGDELGLGPTFQPHSALDFILQDLSRFPHRGWRLIKTGLCSPVVRNRNMAIKALASWPRTSWTNEIQTVVQRARDAEPNKDVKQRLESLLVGAPAP
jgi:hypothetical protein